MTSGLVGKTTPCFLGHTSLNRSRIQATSFTEVSGRVASWLGHERQKKEFCARWANKILNVLGRNPFNVLFNRERPDQHAQTIPHD
ncbi:hypothetical protein FOVSG1_001232 [Fusarium oxysporum f. sp. vasinfectum]